MKENSYIHINVPAKKFYHSEHEKSRNGFSYSDCFKSASGSIDITRFLHERGLLIDCGFTEIPDPGKIEIKLTYFKPSGKYYSDSVLMVDTPDEQDPNGVAASWYEVMEHIRYLLEEGELPGLTKGTKHLHVHVSGHEHPGGYPHIFKNS